MKKTSILKSIATVVLLFIATSGIFAQVTVNNAQIAARPVYDAAYYNTIGNYMTGGNDAASIGAEMPYSVIRDLNVNGVLFNPSTFEWSWTGLTALVDLAASTPIVSMNPVGSILVKATMPGAVGTATIKTQEVSNPKVGTGCTDAVGTSLTIDVKALPSFLLPTVALGGCGLSGTTYDIASGLTGVAPFYVDYTITGVDLAGAAIGAGESYSVTISAADAGLIKIDPTQLAHLGAAATLAATKSGKYTVTVNKVWDELSFKAMNSSLLAVTTSATKTIDIFVYPTPQTQPIKFIKKLP